MIPIQYHDFSPQQHQKIMEIRKHAALGRKLAQRKHLGAEHQVWLEQGDKLVRDLDPYSEDYWDGSWSEWYSAKTYYKGNYPTNEIEKHKVFMQAVECLKRIASSPKVAFRKSKRDRLRKSDILRLDAELLAKIGDDDTDLLAMGKSLREVLLRLKLLRLANRFKAKHEAAFEEVNKLLSEGKQLSLKLFKTCLDKSIFMALLYDYQYRQGLTTFVSLPEVEVQILRLSGFDDSDISDFVDFIHHECQEELENLAKMGLENTKIRLEKAPTVKSSRTFLSTLASWIEIVGGSSITGWNLGMLSSLNLTITEHSALLAKLVGAIALIGKGVKELSKYDSE